MSMMKMTHRQSNSIGTTKGMRCTELCLVIPSPIDQNRCAHWRNPMDMIRQG